MRKVSRYNSRPRATSLDPNRAIRIVYPKRRLQVIRVAYTQPFARCKEKVSAGDTAWWWTRKKKLFHAECIRYRFARKIA